MQQATVNLLADMGAQPATLQSGLVQATASTDTTPPSSSITAPASGSRVTVNLPVTISGSTADAGGGVVGAVEVTVDGGSTWHPATGREQWTYTFTPEAAGTLNIRTRAVDDSGNLELPGAGISLVVVQNTCPCTIWPATAAPSDIDVGPDSSVELGVSFTSDTNGFITGIRFYKGAANTGTHVGNLWSSSGTLLATATFTNETASGWQQVNFSNPVAITANTLYVASYFVSAGHYSADWNYFTTTGVDNGNLHAPENGIPAPNGVFTYGAGSNFPSSTHGSTNYWVDVVFNTSPQ